MKEYILQADTKLRRLPQKPTAEPTAKITNNGKDILFLRMKYSIHNLPHKLLQSIYDAICKVNFESLGIMQMTTEYTRPKNIEHIVTRVKLHQAGKEASTYYLGGQSGIW
jgi:hypothetical protein